MDSLKESPIMQTRSIYKAVAPQIQQIPKTFTKQLREDIIGKGRKGSQDEQYQIGVLESNCGVKVEKINSYRVNVDTGEIKKTAKRMALPDPSLITEDFDGFYHPLSESKKVFAFSFKMLVEGGGAQNRAIDLVFVHLKACVLSIQKGQSYFEMDGSKVEIAKYFFVLDGTYVEQFHTRLNELVPENLKKFFFIGTLSEAMRHLNDEQ
jgi:hypothetical protein